jgi:hypothetical protein
MLTAVVVGAVRRHPPRRAVFPAINVECTTTPHGGSSARTFQRYTDIEYAFTLGMVRGASVVQFVAWLVVTFISAVNEPRERILLS